MPSALTLAQYRMQYGDHMDGHNGWGIAGFVMAVLVLLAVAVLVVWLVRVGGSPRAPADARPVPETPMEILDRRLALSEITPEEYKERAAILTRT